MRYTIPLLTMMITLWACSQSKSNSSDNSTLSDSEVIITGSLILDGAVSEGEAGELMPGEAVSEATIFLKNFPDQTTTSDELGNFSLKLDIGVKEAMKLASEDNVHSLVMWKKSKERENLFGAIRDFQVGEDNTYSTGEVTLRYTNSIRLTLVDEVSNDKITSACKITVNGYDDKIPTEKVGEGRYNSSYMPPADYEFRIICEGYFPKTEIITVTESNGIGNWINQKIALERE